MVIQNLNLLCLKNLYEEVTKNAPFWKRLLFVCMYVLLSSDLLSDYALL
jgi:hypothetical protein